MRKSFVGEFFTVALIAVTKKVYRREGEYQDFPSKILCLLVPKIAVGDSFTVALTLCIEKVWIRVGEHQDFLSKLFVSPRRKFP